MNFNNREKSIIRTLESENDLGFQNIIDQCFQNSNILSHRNFVLVFNRQSRKYESGLTIHQGEDIIDIAAYCEVFAIQLNEFVKTLKYLNQNNYLDIVQTTSNLISKPIVTVGKQELDDNYEFIGIQNQELAKDIAFFNSSTISKRPSLKKLIDNEFLIEEEVRYKNTLDITSTTARNSNRLVLLNLLGFILSCLAIWYSLKTNRQSENNAKSTIENLENIGTQTNLMGNSLDSVSDKLKNLPTSIDEFEKSIKSLSDYNKEQASSFKSNAQELNTTIKSMKESVNKYQEFIDDYGNQLKEVVSLTDVQLKIWKDQQKILLEEFSRKPIFNIEKLNCQTINDTTFIEGFKVLNTGSIEAEIQLIHVEFLTDFNHITQQCFQPYRNTKNRYVYHCQYFNLIPNLSRSLYFKSDCLNKENISYKIEIAYKSKYESGVFEKVVNLNKCND